jgi:hypothetical protein
MESQMVETTPPGVVAEVKTARVSWSAIFAGTVVALGVWALLYVFGLAAGLSALDPQDPGTARTAGIGTGIWSIIAPLIALFIGGYIAARLVGTGDRGTGAIHGAVLWGLTTVAGIALVGSVIGSLVGGVTNLGARAAGAVDGDTAQALGLDAEALVAPVNRRLAEQGRPQITANQMQAALNDITQRSLREGELSRETIVTSIAQRTALDRNDAEAVAAQVEQQVRARGGQLGTTALQAAETTGRVMWGVFGALMLGLISAIAGGLVGIGQGFLLGRRRAEPAVPVGRTGEVRP